MTRLKAAVVGDVGDYRLVALAGVEDLDAVTALEAHVWRLGVDPVTLTATVEDSAARQIRVELGAADGWLATVATRGNWLIEYQLTFGSTVLTWPNGDPDQLPVRSQGS